MSSAKQPSDDSRGSETEMTAMEEEKDEKQETMEESKDNQSELDQAMEAFPSLARRARKSEQNRRDSEEELRAAVYAVRQKGPQSGMNTLAAHLAHSDPTATLRTTTFAQARLGYTQLSAPLSWSNLRCGQQLYPVSGFLLPGTQLCFLGGGSRTGIPELFSLLKTPANLLRPRGNCSGEILLNGMMATTSKFYKRTVAHIPIHDKHLATLTVRETLECSARLRSPAHMEPEHMQKAIANVIEWLGLESCVDTLIGDANLKGISGGQKRRVSIACEVVSGYAICIADMPTNGLDASTALNVVSRCRRVCDAGKSMIMRLASPSADLLSLFDNCCVMSYGHSLYFGSVDKLYEYFHRLGLIKPDSKSVPAWVEEFTVHPSRFLSETLRNKLEAWQLGSSVNDEKISTFISVLFRKSPEYNDLTKHIGLYTHMFEQPSVKGNAVTAAAADIAGSSSNSINDDSNNQCSIVKSGHLEKIAESGTLESSLSEEPTTAATNQINEANPSQTKLPNTQQSFASIMPDVHDEVLQNIPGNSNKDGDQAGSSSIAKSDTEELIELMVNPPDFIGPGSSSSKNKLKSDTQKYSYEKTYDLTALEHGFVWELPRLPKTFTQVKILTKRQFVSTIRNRSLVVTRLLQSVLIALCLLWLFFRTTSIKRDATDDQKNESIRTLFGVLFFIVGFGGFGAVPFISSLTEQLPVFVHQKVNEYHNTHSFYLALVLTEFVFTLLETVIFVLICYFAVGFSVSPIFSLFNTFLILLLVRLTSWSFCMFVASLVCEPSNHNRSTVIAQSIATLVLPILYAFNGFLVPITQVGTFFSKAVMYLSFFTLPFQYLAQDQLHRMDIPDGDQIKQQNIDRYGLNVIGYDTVGYIVTIAVTLGFFTLFNVLAYLSLWYMSDDQFDQGTSIYVVYIRRPIIKGMFILLNVITLGYFDHWMTKRKDTKVKRKIQQFKEEQIQRITSDLESVRDSRNAESLAGPSFAKPEDMVEFPPCVIEWSNLSYSVPDPNQKGGRKLLLSDVNGFVDRGELVALMGPSGAGKSTLLDVLTSKKSAGEITGEILVNGRAKDASFNRKLGYVEQFDSHIPLLTVEEAIRFSADLRLDVSDEDEPEKAKKEAVDRVMSQLGIDTIAERTIDGLSLEESKKVTIAVELVSNPGLLALDEPTTGLGSGAAFAVMSAVHSLAKHNSCSVICTIHQPSSEVLSLFDKLLLLGVGGKTVYFGPIDQIPSYFARELDAHLPIDKEDVNLADFAIDSIKPDSMAIWKQSEEHAKVKATLERGVGREFADSSEDNGQNKVSKFVSGPLHQFLCVVRRQWTILTRDTTSLKVRFLSALAMALFLGSLYFNCQRNGEYSAAMVQSLLYVSVVYATESAANEVPNLVGERATFYREIDSRFYAVLPYYSARVVAQMPLLLVQSVLFAGVLWPLAFSKGNNSNDTDLPNVRAGMAFAGGVGLLILTATTFAQMLAVCTPNQSVGNVLYTTLCTLFRMFGGFLIRVPVMGVAARVINALNFFKYALFWLASNHLSIKDLLKFTEDQVFFKSDASSLVYLFTLVGFLLAFHLVTYLFLAFKRWDKR